MAFTWIPFYKELSYKLLSYYEQSKRSELLQVIKGLKNEYIKYLHKDNDGSKLTDIHPFAIFSIFNRLTIFEKKIEILKYLKDKLNLKSDIPIDFDGIPSINPQKSFWGMNWDGEQPDAVDSNWLLTKAALTEPFDKEAFCKYFNIVLEQHGAKWSITHALFRMNPDKFLSLDKNTKNYLESQGYIVFEDSELSGENYLNYMTTIAEAIKSNKIKEKSFYEISFNAWANPSDISFTNGDSSMNAIDLANLLIKTHNLILHGAPGTGKTHLAMDIAKSIGAEIGFVQFHPSYDYTDFVEGLRPVKEENETVTSFEKIDGTFKLFCEKALSSTKIENGTDNFDESYELLIGKIEKENYVEVETITKSTKFRVELNDYENGLATRTYPNDEYKKGEWIPGHSRFYTKEQLYNIYRGLPGVPKGGHDNYRKAIIKYMKDNLNLKDYVEGTPQKQDKKYVFIIDEINRGELSKIFGELFYSIDPGYRINITNINKENPPLTIKTQYCNMENGPNQFDVILGEQYDFGHFFIPDNVYIIGTMNDIDRSVESMDFAFRRRFTFKEITAKDTQVDILKGFSDETIKRMDSLNNAIDKIEGLSSAYHIGGAYFLKLKDLDNDFDKLWEYHLEGLLREYLRGMDETEDNLEDLHKAYNLENQE